MLFSSPQDFLNAIKNPNTILNEDIKSYIETSSIDTLNFKDQDTQNTALIYSVLNADYDMVKTLIDNGADVNIPGEFDYTPLIIAFEQNLHKIANLLLDKEVDVNHETLNKNTALIYASRSNRTESVKRLLEKGANPNTNSLNRDTPLTYAARNYNVDIAKLLLDSGADPNEKGISEYHPVQILLRKEYEPIDFLELLLDNTNIMVNVVDKDYNTPLMLAVNRESFVIAKMLLKHGADTSYINKKEFNCLSMASKQNAENIVQLLINHGAKDHDEDDSLKTALAYAVENNNIKIAQMLIDNGSPVNSEVKNVALDLRKHNILLGAAMNNNADMVKLLIDSGVNKQYQMSALFETHIRGLNHELKILSENINDIELKGRAVVPLLVLINKKKREPDIVKTYFNIINDEDVELSVLKRLEAKQELRFLKTYMGSFGIKDSVKNAALNSASKNNMLDYVKLYVEGGANINHIPAPTRDTPVTYTPLTYAVQHGNTNMVKFLLDNGADINIQNSDRTNAIDISSPNKNNEIFDMLQDIKKRCDASKLIQEAQFLKHMIGDVEQHNASSSNPNNSKKRAAERSVTQNKRQRER